MNAVVREPASAADLVHTGSTSGSLSLRALRRFPDRTAFAWDGKTLSYRAAEEMIGRCQAVFDKHQLRKGARIAFLAGNVAEARPSSAYQMRSGVKPSSR